MIIYNFYKNFNQPKFAAPMKTLIFALSVIMLFACNSVKEASIDATQFNEKMSNFENVQIVDVRTADEFNSGHIENAINLDVNSVVFENSLSQIYKEIPTFVYCKSGTRSQKAIEIMKKEGFKEIYKLEGGIEAWKNKQLPMTNPVVIEPKKFDPNEFDPKDNSTFKEAIKGNKLVMVDFNAVWCGPCKMMKPYVEKFQDTKRDEVLVYTIDTDVYPELSSEYGISALPTIVFLKNGKELHRNVGYMPENELVDKINQYK